MNKKILLVIPSLGSGGAERQLVNLAMLFKKKGHNVEFVVYHEDDFYKHILDDNSIKVNRILTKNYFDRVFKVRSFIRRSGCDAVISFLETANFLSCFSAVGGKKWKLITTERSSKNSTFLSGRGRIFCWFRRYSDAIVCNSNNSRNTWEKFYPLYSSKLSVIYNSVVLPDITQKYVLKRNGKLNVVVAASYQYLKNPLGLIRALALMDSDLRERVEVNWYGRVEFTDGNTQAYDESIALIKEEGLEGVITLNRPTKDIANKMQEADVVALFSELEGLPNAICEGMMIGKPIIMTRVSDYNVLVDDTNGFLCDSNNPESIKRALVGMLNSTDQELICFGRNSKDKAQKLFSSNAIVDQWLKYVV